MPPPTPPPAPARGSGSSSVVGVDVGIALSVFCFGGAALLLWRRRSHKDRGGSKYSAALKTPLLLGLQPTSIVNTAPAADAGALGCTEQGLQLETTGAWGEDFPLGRTSQDSPEDSSEALAVAATPPRTVPAGMRQLALAELESATHGFAENMKLDEGAFGAVFRGLLPSGEHVAVKAMHAHLEEEADLAVGLDGRSQFGAVAGFVKEAAVLSTYAHPNIVMLLGVCFPDNGGDSDDSSGDGGGGGGGSDRVRLSDVDTMALKEKFKLSLEWAAPGTTVAACASPVAPPVAPLARGAYFLVYELMTGGSLKERLSPTSKLANVHPPLTAPQRIGIAADVGAALSFLHRGTDVPLIHQDVKSANILLGLRGGAVVAKLGDFGTARVEKRLADSGVTHHSTRNVVGTTPYMPFEYLGHGHVSEKTDSFAFGVVLLELLTGKPASDPHTREFLPEQMRSILTNPKKLLPEQLDSLAGNWPKKTKTAFALAKIAARCIEYSTDSRTTVSEELATLNSLAERQ